MNSFIAPALLVIISAHFYSTETRTFAYNEHPKGLHRTKRSCADQRSCLNLVPMLADMFQNDKAGALYTLTYSTILDFVCSKQEELDTCLSGAQCSEFQQSYMAQAVQNSLSFICDDGRAALQSEAACFSRDDYQTGVTTCSEIMNLDVKISTLYIQNGVSEAAEFCDVFENFLGCVHHKVRNSCTNNAADFTRTVYAFTVKQFAEDLNCTLSFIPENV